MQIDRRNSIFSRFVVTDDVGDFVVIIAAVITIVFAIGIGGF